MTGTPDELTELRDDIDQIDDRIASLIAERIDVAEKVGQVKSKEGKNLVDENREAAVKSHYAERFQQEGLAAEHGKELAEYLIEISLKQEKEIKSNS